MSSEPSIRGEVESRLIPAPINPAQPPVILDAGGFVGISVINVTSYDDYAWADEKALQAFQRENPAEVAGSVETTHGLIRMMWEDAPFVFVSGIANRLGFFSQEVTPRAIAQNFVAAHNAAVAALWLTSVAVASL